MRSSVLMPDVEPVTVLLNSFRSKNKNFGSGVRNKISNTQERTGTGLFVLALGHLESNLRLGY